MTGLSSKQDLAVVTPAERVAQIVGDAFPAPRPESCRHDGDWRLRLVTKPARSFDPLSWFRKAKPHV
ncbi:hypothetical protein [Microvirga pudoricolor]|uniref:hypothetical protein n=1 Tax=Microvirga pudoricolor TaxID=2778729 RepID=UPI00194F38DD|nr:hypothetical protein [Microvirga pudoricolor]MBM6593220.1 hypothetical protein [Microvirga pudoricolor]